MSPDESPAGAPQAAPAVALPASRRTVRAASIMGLLAAGLLFLLAVNLSTRVTTVPVSAQFGLLELLPPAFWAGIGLIGFATVLALRGRSEALVVATGTVLLAAIAGTPSLVEPNPRYWDSYLHFGEAQMIAATGHLPPANVGQYYANWPGAFLVLAFLSEAVGIPATSLLLLYPFVSGGLTFLALFTFLRAVFRPPVAAPAAVLSSVFAVWAQYHVSPQSLGFIMALLLLAVVWQREVRWRATGILLFAGLVVSHPTSTLLLLGILVVLCLTGLLHGRTSPDSREDVRSLRYVTLAYGAIWFAWLYFHATASYEVAETAILTRMGRLVSLPEQTANLATARTAENLYSIAPALRLGTLALFGILGLLSLPFLGQTSDDRRLRWFLLSSLVAIAVVGAADILGFGGQFYDRCLLLFSVLAPAMCLTGLRRIRFPEAGRRALVAILVAASLAGASTVYYQETFYHVPDTAVALSEYVQHVPPKAVVVDGMFPVPVWLDPTTRTPFSRMYFYEVYPDHLDAYTGLAPTYAVFDDTAVLWYRQWRGIDIYRYYDQDTGDFSRIYDNGRGAVYLVGD